MIGGEPSPGEQAGVAPGEARRIHVRVAADQRPESLRDAVSGHARKLGLRGWARADAHGDVRIHAEGPRAALTELLDMLTGTGEVDAEHAKLEGHEQFAPRGVSAGVFVVHEHQATAHHYDLRLEVQVGDHGVAHNDFEGRYLNGGVIVWDRGSYEQGGRVPWPEAIERGHAVFVLHGEKLHGGFALQRTRRGEKPQWLLIKRRDDEARPGSDIVAEQPQSVLSRRTLAELLS